MLNFLKELPQIYIISILSLCLLIVWVMTRDTNIFTLMTSGFGAAWGISRQQSKPTQQNFDVNKMENVDISTNQPKGEKIE